MSDIINKTSGFGIDKLGNIPASTPLDDLEAMELILENQQPTSGKFTMTDLRNGNEYEFDTLAEMLQYAKCYVVGYMGKPNISLSAPGYTVGSITMNPDYREDAEFLLKWREKKSTPEPRSWCDECGSGDISNGKCLTCGETDMVRTEWYTFSNHQETISKY